VYFAQLSPPHILGGCPVALEVRTLTVMIKCLAFWPLNSKNFYPPFADLQSLQTSEAPQAPIPSILLTTPYRPDIMVYNPDKFTNPLLH